MKTNRVARRLVRIRRIALSLLVLALVGIEFRLGESIASRIGQTTARQTTDVPVPNVSLGELSAVARQADSDDQSQPAHMASGLVRCV